ncbi:MAG: rhamnulokinase [Desulfobacterales bacterium]|nr:MAG: rhamnulokinase [Desulfobacterales bacterium]
MKPFEPMLAFDLGNSGGRAQWGQFDGQKLQFEEIHKFRNGPVRIGERWYWDILRIFEEMQNGLRQATVRAGVRSFSAGVDTWGVDYGLLDATGELMAPIHHHRDPRTDDLYPEIFAKVAKQDIYQLTGIMFIQFNTLVQLFADLRTRPWLLENSRALLFIPDLFNYFLSGVRFSEITIASTSQFFDPSRKTWALPIFQSLGLPTRLLQPIVRPGTAIGPLLPALKRNMGLEADISIIAVGSHDTASAWAATPLARDRPSALISVGTWSLLGMELDRPNLSEAARAWNFTNECGVNETIVFHKIIGGLWLIQECRRCWQQAGQPLRYEQIHQAAARAQPLKFLFDPDDKRFLNPAHMPEAIRRYFKDKRLPAPEGVAPIARSIYESLALNYRLAVAGMEQITGRPIEVIHIVGGGAQAKLLCQFTADATGKHVIAGPVEATTVGNMLSQLQARGELKDLSEGREIVRRSFALQAYAPHDTAAWDEAFGRFRALVDHRDRL